MVERKRAEDARQHQQIRLLGSFGSLLQGQRSKRVLHQQCFRNAGHQTWEKMCRVGGVGKVAYKYHIIFLKTCSFPSCTLVPHLLCSPAAGIQYSWKLTIGWNEIAAASAGSRWRLYCSCTNFRKKGEIERERGAQTKCRRCCSLRCKTNEATDPTGHAHANGCAELRRLRNCTCCNY